MHLGLVFARHSNTRGALQPAPSRLSFSVSFCPFCSVFCNQPCFSPLTLAQTIDWQAFQVSSTFCSGTYLTKTHCPQHDPGRPGYQKRKSRQPGLEPTQLKPLGTITVAEYHIIQTTERRAKRQSLFFFSLSFSFFSVSATF
jgi:hypothetical protein